MLLPEELSVDVACVELSGVDVALVVEDSSSSSSSLLVDVALLLSLDVEPVEVKLLLVIGGVLVLPVDSRVVVPDNELILLVDSATELLLDGSEQPLSKKVLPELSSTAMLPRTLYP